MGSPFEGSPRAGVAEYVKGGCFYKNHQITKLTNRQIDKSANRQIGKLTNHQIGKSTNQQISKSKKYGS